MKPRIKKIDGLWYCGVPRASRWYRKEPLGLGYSPKTAYDDWQRDKAKK